MINSGNVQVGNGGTTGNLGAGPVTNNTTLTFNRSNALNAPNAIGGTGQVVKNGTGTLTLSGVSTYTGSTTINTGTLALADGGKLNFKPGANGVSNKVGGVGAFTVAGDFTVDLSAADTTTGNSWLLVDVNALAFESFASTFSISNGVTTFTESADVHTLVDGASTWTYDEATGVLSVVTITDPYVAWAAGLGLVGGPDDDDDGDGLSNHDEYAFGLDPESGSSVSPVTVQLSKAAGTFTYTRRKPSLTGLTYKIWTSTNLASWTEDTGAIQTPTDSGDNQSVAVTVSGAPLTAPKFFVRVTAE